MLMEGRRFTRVVIEVMPGSPDDHAVSTRDSPRHVSAIARMPPSITKGKPSNLEASDGGWAGTFGADDRRTR